MGPLKRAMSAKIWKRRARLEVVGALGEVLHVEVVGLGCEGDIAGAVVEIGEFDGRSLGERGAGCAFLDADEKFDGDIGGVEDADAPGRALEAVGVSDGDIEFAFDCC